MVLGQFDLEHCLKPKNSNNIVYISLFTPLLSIFGVIMFFTFHRFNNDNSLFIIKTAF